MKLPAFYLTTWGIWLALICLVGTTGCTRRMYRVKADQEANLVVAERNVDSRWRVDDYAIDPDPRSRYFDPYDPDRPPMPADDPASHQYMHLVDGRTGWKHWHDNGERFELENPEWNVAIPSYIETSEEGAVQLDIDSALQLAYVHSPALQTQLETLYLSALDVTTERFRLQTQFFGGYDGRYAHNGSLIPPGLGFSPLFRRFVITPAIQGPGTENNRVTVGRPFATSPALQLRKRFATAGELIVGFANSFVFEFTGGDANLAASLANFSLVQPLLRGAGKDIALEQLTLVERILLANVRAYSQFRQGLYTQIAIGELGVAGPQRTGGGTAVSSFSGSGGVGGYLGLLQRLQTIRNRRYSLTLQIRTLAILEAHEAGGVIDQVQVDQFRQSIENDRSVLLGLENDYQLELDRYKTGNLGLPPDLPIDLDDGMIDQFQLVAPKAIEVQDEIDELYGEIGEVPEEADLAAVRKVLADVTKIADRARQQLDDIPGDLERMDNAVETRERGMDDEARAEFAEARKQLREDLVVREKEYRQARADLKGLAEGLNEETKADTFHQLIVTLGALRRLVELSVVLQARARLEAVTIDAIEMDPREAFQIALSNRLDFMNGRAALVDTWRLIQVNADALKSVVNITASGELRTARNNPVSFRAPTGNARFGIEFDAPFTRKVERNAYRESLINYQRSRRSFIQSRDGLHLGLRALLRQIRQLRENLEIQRGAVAIAIRRVDSTRLALYAPPPTTVPGQRAVFGPTAAQNTLLAFTSLRQTQDAFVSAWLNYYAAKLRLYRELGIMQLDNDGRWIELPLPNAEADSELDLDDLEEIETPAEPMLPPLPPPVPAAWLQLIDQLDELAPVNALDGDDGQRVEPSDPS